MSHVAIYAFSTRVTPMTRERVGCPSLLSAKGLAEHNTRYGGPGTRRKNPAKFDAAKKRS